MSSPVTLVDLFLSIHTKTSEAVFKRPALAAGINRLSTISRMTDPGKKQKHIELLNYKKAKHFVHLGTLSLFYTINGCYQPKIHIKTTGAWI